MDRFTKVITSDNKPYGLHRRREERLFEGEKIMVLRKCSGKPVFTYTDFPCYVSQSYNVIKTSRVDNKFLTGLLNSTLIAFWLRFKGKMQGSNYQLDNEPLSQIPICVPNDTSAISLLVSDIIVTKQKNPTADTTALENEIGLLVYKLYGLSYAEVKVIDPNIEELISEKNYNKRPAVESLPAK